MCMCLGVGTWAMVCVCDIINACVCEWVFVSLCARERLSGCVSLDDYGCARKREWETSMEKNE